MTIMEQQMDALDKANRVRLAVATIKAYIRSLPQKTGTETVANLLEQGCPGHVSAMRVGALLGSIAGVGRVKAGRWLLLADVRSADRRVGDLSDRQLRVLAGLLREASR